MALEESTPWELPSTPRGRRSSSSPLPVRERTLQEKPTISRSPRSRSHCKGEDSPPRLLRSPKIFPYCSSLSPSVSVANLRNSSISSLISTSCTTLGPSSPSSSPSSASPSSPSTSSSLDSSDEAPSYLLLVNLGARGGRGGVGGGARDSVGAGGGKGSFCPHSVSGRGATSAAVRFARSSGEISSSCSSSLDCSLRRRISSLPQPQLRRGPTR